MKIHPLAWCCACLAVWLSAYSLYDPSWTGHANLAWFIHGAIVHWDNLVGINSPKDNDNV